MSGKPIRPVIIFGAEAHVILTRGHVAIIDAADVYLIDKWNWAILVTSNTIYARRNRLVGDPKIGGKVILLHRAITGAPLDMDVDHVDGDGLNNRRSNLRIATTSENCRNRRRRRDNTSGMKGAFFDKFTGKWMAAIKYDGKFHNLGRFNTAQEAHAAYCVAAKDIFGEFARLS